MLTGERRLAGGLKRLVLVALATLTLGRGAAAAADVRRGGMADGAAVIVVAGAPSDDDVRLFRALSGPIGHAVVRLSGEGGSTMAGIALGQAIRDHGYATEAPAGARCVGACGLAWLAGQPRTLGPGSTVGLSTPAGDEGVAARALVGAYLVQIGMPDASQAWRDDAGQADWAALTPEMARGLGIEIAAAKAAPAPPPDRRGGPADRRDSP